KARHQGEAGPLGIALAQSHDGGTHEIARAIVPCPAQPATAGGLTIRDKPIAVRKSFAAAQAGREIGVGRARLWNEVDQAVKNKAAAALSASSPSMRVKRKPSGEMTSAEITSNAQ